MTNYLIFGGSGFVGTHLTRKLVNQGDSVFSVDIKEPRERLNGVTYEHGDVRCLGDLNPDLSIDCIVNLAAVHTTPGHPSHEYYETNIAGALEVTALAERIDVREIVFTSSISVYGPGEDMKTEQIAPAPSSSYGYSKLISEQVHRQWASRGQQDRKLTIVRPAVIFGPGENGNFTRLAKLLKKGFFIYPGRKDTIKACIYIDDLLAAIDFARNRNERYALFNGAYPNRYSLQQIVETLIEGQLPKARTFMVPRFVVSALATMLQPLKSLELGIHPDRVQKLVRSTDIYPEWLVERGFEFPESLRDTMNKWSKQTDGTFD